MAKSKPQSGAASKTPKESESKPESLSFEGALQQLEETVGRLEGGEMPLEESLELFEAGVKLSRQCNETLEAAERRIEILVADRERSVRGEVGGAWDTEEFESDLDSEDESDEFED